MAVTITLMPDSGGEVAGGSYPEEQERPMAIAISSSRKKIARCLVDEVRWQHRCRQTKSPSTRSRARRRPLATRSSSNGWCRTCC